MTNPKILVLDIETAPGKGYLWDIRRPINLGVEQLLAPSRLLAVGAKWLGNPKTFYSSVDYHAGEEIRDGRRQQMMANTARLLAAADAIVTFNGNRFDLPKLWGELAVEGCRPALIPPSIDVRVTTDRMGFTSGRLAHVAPLLGCARKHKHDGFTLWAEYMEGIVAARKEMKVYNLQDVKVLEEVYLKVRPFIRNHPWLGDARPGEACPNCNSRSLTQVRPRRTRYFRVDVFQCNDCGAAHDGSRRKL